MISCLNEICGGGVEWSKKQATRLAVWVVVGVESRLRDR